jgi:Ser/Thr protein kinase RdoA (MazF antagonist)
VVVPLDLSPAVPSPATASKGYASLNPQGVLEALEQVGLFGDGRVLQLNSYENRVFQVYLDGAETIVAKFYRPLRWSDAQILEEHAFAGELADAEIPVAAPLPMRAHGRGPKGLRLLGTPPTLAGWSGPSGEFRLAVTPSRPGRAPDLDDPATLRWIGRYLGRIHTVGSRRQFEHRLTLDVATFGRSARSTLADGRLLPPSLEQAWLQTCDAALDAVAEAFDRVGVPERFRLHGDCHRGNILWSGAGPHFVDFDDAVNGPAIQDLWMLLAGDRQAMTRQLIELVEGYEAFREFDWRECALVEPLRTLRMIHHSAWIARRWDDPAFPAAFPWFGTPAYWTNEIQMLREQLEAMQQPPLGSA